MNARQVIACSPGLRDGFRFLAVAFALFVSGCASGPPAVTRENPYGRSDFEDVPIGAQAIDFSLRDVMGNVRCLSDFYRDAIVVMQFASATCPEYVDGLGEVGRVMRDYRRDDIVFLTIYTIEANANYLGRDERPRTWEDRVALASRSCYEYSYQMHGKRRHAAGTKPPNYPNRITLVDELPDIVAGIYGAHPKHAPNPCFVIDRDGTIAATARQTNAAFIRKTLERLLSR